MTVELVPIEQPRTDCLTTTVTVADSYNIAHPKKRAMLIAYARTGNISQACAAIRIGRRTHYDWQDSDDDYAAAFKQAGEDAADALEAEARRRAFEGSDTLLIFLLKGLRPERYRERYDHRLQGGNEKLVFGAVTFSGGKTVRNI